MKLLFVLLILSFTNESHNYPGNLLGEKKSERVKVCGRILEVRFGDIANKPTIIQFAGEVNNQPVIVLINPEDKKNFSYRPENFLKNKMVCISGKVVDINGKMEIIISRQDEIRVDDEEEEIEVKANDFNIFNKYFDDDDK